MRALLSSSQHLGVSCQCWDLESGDLGYFGSDDDPSTWPEAVNARGHVTWGCEVQGPIRMARHNY